jgi:hypothetical protein
MFPFGRDSEKELSLEVQYSGAPYDIQIKHDEMSVRYLQCNIFWYILRNVSEAERVRL